MDGIESFVRLLMYLMEYEELVYNISSACVVELDIELF